MTTEKLKRHKSPSTDQIPAELIKTGGRTIRCEFHKHVNSIWNKEELPEDWKELIIVPLDTKGDKTDCSSYRGVVILSTTYKSLSKILLSRLTSYAEEIVGYHQCGFRRKRPTAGHIFCVRKILEKKREFIESVHQLFIDFEKAYDSVRKYVLYNIVIEFGIPVKLVRLIRMC